MSKLCRTSSEEKSQVTGTDSLPLHRRRWQFCSDSILWSHPTCQPPNSCKLTNIFLTLGLFLKSFGFYFLSNPCHSPSSLLPASLVLPPGWPAAAPPWHQRPWRPRFQLSANTRLSFAEQTYLSRQHPYYFISCVLRVYNTLM